MVHATTATAATATATAQWTKPARRQTPRTKGRRADAHPRALTQSTSSGHERRTIATIYREARPHCRGFRRTTMDKHRKEGTKNEIKGKVNELVGDMTDDHSQEARGRAQQNLGEKQREYGEARDQARDINSTRH
jgi:uncharacterized protein YjbJ (UPF0337 family)